MATISYWLGNSNRSKVKRFIENARKEYKQLLEEGWKKTSIFRSYF